MRSPTPTPLVTTLLLLVGTTACAGAEMNRGASSGDDIGEGDADGDDTTAEPTTQPGTTDATGDSTTQDPTQGVDGDSGETDPTDPTGPVDTTDPTDPTDASSSEGSSGDPSDTDPSTSSTDAGSTTDATDTQGVEFVDLSGYTIVQTDSAREFVIPDNTLVNVGTVIVIGRNASSATFQDFWGQSWGDEVVYFEGLDNFPTINGAETYALLDPGQNLVDGPTPPLELATVLARTDASAAGDDDAAWELGLTPNFDSTPGVAVATGGTTGVPYISEYSDPTGSGNFDYEFVEIHVPG